MNHNTYPAWIDVHLHLDGSVHHVTARKLANSQGILVPASHEELKRSMSVSQDCRDLNDYLDCFELSCSLLQEREAVRTCMDNLLAELYREGLKYTEIRFAPQKSCLKGLNQYEVTQAALEAIENSPIPCGLILSLMRGNDTHEANMETIEVAKALYGKGVVAVDLAGAEALYPTSMFREEFAHVRQVGVPLIVHAGEAAGAESVREAVEAGARRIGHGVKALEDSSVVQMLVERQITLELCPTSNLNTGIFHSYAEYPLRQLMKAGVRVCINTDNMTVSNTTLAKEWQNLITALQLRDEEIELIVRNTIDATFAAEEIKKTLYRALNEQINYSL